MFTVRGERGIADRLRTVSGPVRQTLMYDTTKL